MCGIPFDIPPSMGEDLEYVKGVGVPVIKTVFVVNATSQLTSGTSS